MSMLKTMAHAEKKNQDCFILPTANVHNGKHQCRLFSKIDFTC